MSTAQSFPVSCLEGYPTDIEQTFWQLWQQNQTYLYRCCLKWMNGNRIDAEEALSQAMFKAWEKLPDHAEKITNLRAWLVRLTHNLCIDIHRERRRKALPIENIEEIATREKSAVVSCLDSPELALLHHELGQYIRRAIDSLSARLRTPFILRYYHQVSYQDIARKLAISIDNVYKRIQQARDILQQRLRQYLAGVDDSPLSSPAQKDCRQKQGVMEKTRKTKKAFPDNLQCLTPPNTQGISVVESCPSDETMIPDAQAAMTGGCMGETINYYVTASCLETQHYGWNRSHSPLGWS